MSAWGDSIQSSAAAAMLRLVVFTIGAVIYRWCGRNIVYAFLHSRLCRQSFRLNFCFTVGKIGHCVRWETANSLIWLTLWLVCRF